MLDLVAVLLFAGLAVAALIALDRILPGERP